MGRKIPVLEDYYQKVLIFCANRSRDNAIAVREARVALIVYFSETMNIYSGREWNLCQQFHRLMRRMMMHKAFEFYKTDHELMFEVGFVDSMIVACNAHPLIRLFGPNLRRVVASRSIRRILDAIPIGESSILPLVLQVISGLSPKRFEQAHKKMIEYGLLHEKRLGKKIRLLSVAWEVDSFKSYVDKARCLTQGGNREVAR